MFLEGTPSVRAHDTTTSKPYDKPDHFEVPRLSLRQTSFDDPQCLSKREWKSPLTCWLRNASRSGQTPQGWFSKVLVLPSSRKWPKFALQFKHL